MSYTKISTSFKDHETVLTAAHLQHIENGIADNDAALVNRVRTDVSNQNLSATQKSNARMNIDTPSTAEMTSAVAAEANLRITADAAMETKTDGIQDEVDQAKADITDLQAVSSSMVKTKTVTGNPVTIKDALAGKAKKLVVSLKPKQDLHGYDKPWIGGAGKNLLPCDYIDRTINGVSFVWNSRGVLTTSGTPTASLRYDLFSGNSFVLSAGTYKLYGPENSYPESKASVQLRKLIGSSADDNVIAKAGGTNSPVTFTVSEDTTVFPVVFISNTLGADAAFSWYPMLINASGDDGNYEPYANTCPIEGYTSLEVTRAGKNLLNITAATTELNGLVFDVKSDGTITVNGTATAQTILEVGYSESLPGSDRTLWGIPDGASTETYFMTRNGSSGNTYKNGFALTDEGVVRPRIYVRSGVTCKNLVFRPAIYITSDMSTLSVDISSITGGTVYGGSVTINEDGSGTVLVDRVKYVCGENEDLTYSTNTLTFYHTNQTQLPVQASKNIISAGFEGICSKFCPAHDGMNDSAWRTSTDYLVGYTTSRSLRFKIPIAGSDITAAKAFVTGTEVVYKIATPLSYPLTTTQLQTLLGTNHVMTNLGELELAYKTEKNSSVDKSLSAFPVRTVEPSNFIAIDDGADEIPVKDLTVTIEPEQDLHGYNKPWIGGAGKNLVTLSGMDLDKTVSGITLSTNGSELTIKGTATSEVQTNAALASQYEQMPMGPFPAGTYTIKATGFEWQVQNDRLLINARYSDNSNVENAYSKRIGGNNSGAITFTATQTFKFGLFLALQSGSTFDCTVQVQFEVGSTATDYEPYENICPISGADNVIITNHGKNLLCYEGWKWHTNGKFVAQATAKASQLLAVKPGDTLTASKAIAFSEASANCVVRQFNKDKEFVSSQSFMLYNVLNSTYTVPEGIYYVGITQFYEAGQDTSELKAPYQAQVELGSEATAYEPYQGVNHTISLEKAGTVYGGTLNVLTGELMVDSAMKRISEADIKNSSTSVVGRYFSGGNYLTDRQSNTPILCNAYAGRAIDNTSESGVVYISSSGQIAFNTSFATLADFQSWIGNNELYIVYHLATPITYQLTPQEVSTLLGNNTFSCDAGKITLSYRADPSLLINKLLNAIMAYGITV